MKTSNIIIYDPKISVIFCPGILSSLYCRNYIFHILSFYYLGWKIVPSIPCYNNWTSMEGYWILFGNFQLQWQGSKEIDWQFQLLFGQTTWGFLVWGYFGYFDAGKNSSFILNKATEILKIFGFDRLEFPHDFELF